MSFLHLPLLVLLHFVTLIYSLLPSNPFKRNSSSSSSPSSTSKPSRPPPRHVALLLVPPPRRPNTSATATSSSIGDDEGNVKEVLMESVLRAVRWAEEEGVQELTVFEGGKHARHLASLHSPLLSLLTQTPPSPPPSTPSSPPSPLPVWSSLEEPSHPSAPSDSLKPHSSRTSCRKDVGDVVSNEGAFKNGMASLTVWSSSNEDQEEDEQQEGIRKRRSDPSSPYSSSSRHHSHAQPITLNLLLPSTSYTLLSNLTRSLSLSKTDPETITVPLIQSLVDDLLPFQTKTEPELLLIHHLLPSPSPSTPFASFINWLSSFSKEPEAVELHGFPPWLLRLTEICQPPQQQQRPRRRRRRVATLLQPLETNAWEAGMCAWEGVEQRFGR